MKYNLLFLILSLIVFTNGLIAQTPEQILIGTKHKIYSEKLSEERAYWVSLPDSYGEPYADYKRYPLVILLDGHVHFKATAGMINFMSSGNSDKRDLPEMIVVGVLNVNRRRDFTPDKVITKRENDTGGGDKFLSFLESELIPTLDRTYRTKPYRILIGHSLGGLLTTHAYMQQRSAFRSFISIDPSFGTWEDEVMDEKVDKIIPPVFQRSLFLASANWRERSLKNEDRHSRFFESINKKSEEELNAKYKYYEEKNHSSVPFPAIYDGLSFIFEGYNFSFRTETSRKHLVEHYKEFSKKVLFDFYPPEVLVNRIGYRYLRSENVADQNKALSFFKLNTELYAKSFNAFDSLGEAHFKLGNEEEAIKNFKESLVLNPENENAKKIIEKIMEK